MKSLKVMSIIGIIFFSITLMFVFLLWDVDTFSGMAWGAFGLMYALPFSIVALVSTNAYLKKNSEKIPKSFALVEHLAQLTSMKEKGNLTEDEFQMYKKSINKLND